jgi:tetratricopeptide (TPR) repeat protein
MSNGRFSHDILNKLQAFEKEGRINGLIIETARNYHKLGPIKPEALDRIAYYLQKWGMFISPETIEAIRTIPQADLECSGIRPMLPTLTTEPGSGKTGSLYFPTVTAGHGLVHEIRVIENSADALERNRFHLLDKVGSAVISALGGKLKRFLFWHPEPWHFLILDTFGNEDHQVAGESMGLPLGLAIFSAITGIIIPPDLTATGVVARDGSIKPVEGIFEKLNAIRCERFFIRKVLVAVDQEIGERIPSLEIIRVSNISEALSIVFPESGETIAIPDLVNIEKELQQLKNQYESYLIDTCIENSTHLIRYLKSKQCTLPDDSKIPALFECYRQKGNCYCHKGNVRETQKNLENAKRLFEKYPGFIGANAYWDSRINFAVFLKDIFRYREAAAIHLRINEKIEQLGGLNHDKGKNLSSLAQLYLAQRRFSDAEKFQKRAISLILEEERHRNYGYLAQVYMRAGDLEKANDSLEKAHHLNKQSNGKDCIDPFYDWILAEYLYRCQISPKVARKTRLLEFEPLISRYPEITWYVPGLIHKFAGLAIIEMGDEAVGLEKLNNAIRFFDAQLDYPVLSLLGATVRVERSLYFLQKGEPKRIADDLEGIRKCLGLQKDIKLFFEAEMNAISGYLKSGESGQKEIEKVLASLQRQIPY